MWETPWTSGGFSFPPDTLAWPWWCAAVISVGYRMLAGNCPAPTIIEVDALKVIAIVYLALTYLTFISQE